MPVKIIERLQCDYCPTFEERDYVEGAELPERWWDEFPNGKIMCGCRAFRVGRVGETAST